MALNRKSRLAALLRATRACLLGQETNVVAEGLQNFGRSMRCIL